MPGVHFRPLATAPLLSSDAAFLGHTTVVIVASRCHRPAAYSLNKKCFCCGIRDLCHLTGRNLLVPWTKTLKKVQHFSPRYLFFSVSITCDKKQLENVCGFLPLVKTRAAVENKLLSGLRFCCVFAQSSEAQSCDNKEKPFSRMTSKCLALRALKCSQASLRNIWPEQKTSRKRKETSHKERKSLAFHLVWNFLHLFGVRGFCRDVYHLQHIEAFHLLSVNMIWTRIFTWH